MYANFYVHMYMYIVPCVITGTQKVVSMSILTRLTKSGYS